MKTTYAVILCVLLLLVSACAPKVNDPADLQAIQDMCAEFAKQTTERNLPAYLSTYYTTDAIRLPPNGSPIAGIEAIRKLAQADLDQNTSIKETDSVVSVMSSGDMAHARGTWTWAATPKASGLSVVNDHGKWVSAYQRQSDGTWKCIYDIWSSDQPAAGSTATGEDEQALYQIERDWAEALVKKDIATLDKMLATEFQANYVGLVGNKKEVLSVLKSDTSKTESLVLSEMKAIVFGDRAIVNGLTTEKSITAGKDTSGQYRWTDVFVKREGRWQCVTGYAAKVG